MNRETIVQVESLLKTAETHVTNASRLVAPGIGETGLDLHELLVDTAEKIAYCMGVLDDERVIGA
jgi:hypothetical protein